MRSCDTKDISKSKCFKTDGLGPLLAVEMFKKCRRLWLKARFEANILKTPHVLATLGRSRQDKNNDSCDINYNYNYSRSYTIPQLQLQLQLQLHDNYNCNYTALRHATTVRYYRTLQYTTRSLPLQLQLQLHLQQQMQLQLPLHNTTTTPTTTTQQHYTTTTNTTITTLNHNYSYNCHYTTAQYIQLL